MTYFFHICLLMILYTILSIQDKIKPNIKSIGKFIIFTIIIVLFNYSISNSHLLWMFALINIVFYGLFIQFIVINDQFDVIEKYDLQENKGSFFSFVYADGYLYLTHTTENINEERMALGSNEICIFDLNKKIFLEEVKILSNTYPFDIYFDENNRNLIIANGENGPTSNHVWTIYNIDTNEETIIPIDFSEMGNDVPARSSFLEIKDDKYYLLFPSYLVEYDIQGKKSKTYNLKDLGIENAVLITAQ